MVRVSSQPTGTLYVCDRCHARTFNEALAKDHMDATGHTIRPLLEVRRHASR